ncbi:MAG: hypothetical protein JSR59_04600 [Proteobacteria bacterium]|nr:hypothetical protein [Pseudomonadota bacterium]
MKAKLISGSVAAAGMVATLGACGGGASAGESSALASAQGAGRGHREAFVYDSFERPGGYTQADYDRKWTMTFGPGEMAVEDTRRFADGEFSVSAVPFRTSADLSVFDHIKYFAASTRSFDVPRRGSITFKADIDVRTPGTEPGRVIHGTYGPPGSYPNGAPYAASTYEGQQAAATLHMIDFTTGQLFDWFVSGRRAFTLIERLPSSLTGSPIPAGRDQMYTQIIDEIPITPGPHQVAITLTRGDGKLSVQYRLDGRKVSQVSDVGVPLDVQGVRFTGTYPSLGRGEKLVDRLDSVAIGHGLFSLLDAFPFQHPEAPELSVSIPTSQRIFGQGAAAKFGKFTVEIDSLPAGD